MPSGRCGEGVVAYGARRLAGQVDRSSRCVGIGERTAVYCVGQILSNCGCIVRSAVIYLVGGPIDGRLYGAGVGRALSILPSGKRARGRSGKERGAAEVGAGGVAGGRRGRE